MNQNLARAIGLAIGLAIGGALLAATSSGTVFLVNAASFAAVLAVLMTWHSTRAADALPREHVGEAIRAGGRYIAASPGRLRPAAGHCRDRCRGRRPPAAPAAGPAVAGLALSPLAGLVWRFRSIPPETLLPAGDWPAPVLAPDQTPEGPVLVGIQYRARPGLEDQLMTALQQTKDGRRRTGAISWRPWHDASDPGRVLEEFVVASWDDHLRQHGRVTKREQAHLERVRELTDPDHPVVVTHWLAVSSRKLPGSPAKPT